MFDGQWFYKQPIQYLPHQTSSKLTTVSAVASANIDSSSITIPGTSQTGDLAIFVDYAANDTIASFSGSDINIPNWFKFSNDYSQAAVGSAGGVQRVQAFGKILESTDPGSSLAGTNVSTNTGARRKTIVVFRANRIFKGFNVVGIQSQFTTSNPAAQSLSSSDSKFVPMISCAIYRSSGAISPVTFSPAATGSVSSGTTAHFYYLIQNTSPVDITSIDINDEGALNFLASFWIELY